MPLRTAGQNDPVQSWCEHSLFLLIVVFRFNWNEEKPVVQKSGGEGVFWNEVQWWRWPVQHDNAELISVYGKELGAIAGRT